MVDAWIMIASTERVLYVHDTATLAQSRPHRMEIWNLTVATQVSR